MCFLRSRPIWRTRVYEIDPLICPRCSGQMKIVAFIQPPQGDVGRLAADEQGRTTTVPSRRARQTRRLTTDR